MPIILRLQPHLGLAPNRWFAWHLFPGYTELPYVSPVFVRKVRPVGLRKLEVAYRDACYTAGVQEREDIIWVISSSERHLAVRRKSEAEEVAVIVPMSARWLREFQATFASRMREGESADAFLDREFGERSEAGGA